MAMWLILSLWAVLASSFLFCTDAMHSSHSSYANYDLSSPVAAYRAARKNNLADSQADADSSSSYLYDTEKDAPSDRSAQDDYLDLNLWPMRELPRQHFGTKASVALDSSASRSVESLDDLLDDVQVGESDAMAATKTKRDGHSLSIVNPLDVLRQRLMLEMARRKMKENQDQIKANDAILKSLGKRSIVVKREAAPAGGKSAALDRRTKKHQVPFIKNEV